MKRTSIRPSVVYAELRECGRLDKPGTWDSLRRKHNVPLSVANTAWRAGVKARRLTTVADG